MITERRLFLIDGIGAVFSAFSLGYLGVVWYRYVGMPVSILYPLASIAALFASYSLTCYLLKLKNQRRLLRVIGMANFSYSLITAFLVLAFWGELKTWGIVYFIGEILILWVLAYVEINRSLEKNE